MGKWSTNKPPNKRGRYLVTVDTGYGRMVMQADRNEYPKDNFYWYILPSGGSNGVIAWQKCPEAYKGEIE